MLNKILCLIIKEAIDLKTVVVYSSAFTCFVGANQMRFYFVFAGFSSKWNHQFFLQEIEDKEEGIFG